jgi:hypothetical protein
MGGIGYWLGGGEALIAAGLGWLVLRHYSNLPSGTHPWIHRGVILLMYAAGTVLAVSTVGLWAVRTIRRFSGMVAGGTGPGGGIGWALVTIGGLALIAGLIVALIWAPNPAYAYVALAAPLVLALAVGGIVREFYVVTSAPAHQLVSQVAVWAGG